MVNVNRVIRLAGRQTMQCWPVNAGFCSGDLQSGLSLQTKIHRAGEAIDSVKQAAGCPKLTVDAATVVSGHPHF